MTDENRFLWIVDLDIDVPFVDFNPLDGLDVLRALVKESMQCGTGILVTRRVGLTSHVAEILRMNRVPSKMVAA